MSTRSVVFLHGLNQPILDWIMNHVPGDFSVNAVRGTSPEPDIIAAVRSADFLMVYRASPGESVIHAAGNTRLVQLLAAGYDDIDVAAIQRMNVPVAQNAGANSWAVADLVVLLMLSLYRRLVAADRSTREGRWRQPITGLNTYEMEDKLVGIVGMGNVGRKVARRVRGFDARVQYWDKYPVQWGDQAPIGASVEMDELFRTSDIVSLHVPLTSETRHLVDADVLALMKPSAILINTSRGEVVDERALVTALTEGKVAGAGLDVFEKEPVDPANPLLKLENVVVHPHSAGTTVDTWQRRLDFAFENMRRVERGQTPLGLVRDLGQG
jgi:phosphoglycerate dehydrogenase-like enzyme